MTPKEEQFWMNVSEEAMFMDIFGPENAGDLIRAFDRKTLLQRAAIILFLAPEGLVARRFAKRVRQLLMQETFKRLVNNKT